MDDFIVSEIEATEKYAEIMCKKAPLDEESKDEINKMLSKGTLEPRIQEVAHNLLERRKKQHEQEQQSHGMTR